MRTTRHCVAEIDRRACYTDAFDRLIHTFIMSATNGGSEEKKSPEAAVKITVNPDLPLKRDGVETLAGLSPRMTKKQRSSYADHTGLWLSSLLFFARP